LEFKHFDLHDLDGRRHLTQRRIKAGRMLADFSPARE
jgi:hypothetical protein